MARRAIPMIAFPRVRSMFIYIFMFVSLTQVCIVYVVKEVTSFRGARSGIIERALELYRAAERKLLVALLAYVETGTNS